MTRLNQLAANLYPRWWRDRYGDEFAALLDDARPGFAGTIDICKGAFAMQATRWSLKSLVAISAIVGVAVAAGVTFSMQKQYQSTAVLRLPASDNAAMTQQVVGLTNQVLSRKSLVNVIRQQNLYQTELARHPQEEVIEGMRQAIQIVPLMKGGDARPAFLLRFIYPDPKLSESTTQSLAQAFVEASKSVEFVELSTANQPVSPNRVAIGVAGLAGGLLTGALLALLVWLSRTFAIVRRVPPSASA